MHDTIERKPTTAQRRMTRLLNDMMRKDAARGELGRNQYTMTRGVRRLIAELEETQTAISTLFRLMRAVAEHEPAAGDDPYGERDFGAFEFGDERLFWKIDYYDRAFERDRIHPGTIAARAAH